MKGELMIGLRNNSGKIPFKLTKLKEDFVAL